jgi:Na+/H+-dicarboxylate symporter
MCAQHLYQRKELSITAMFYGLAIIFALISGLSDYSFLHSLGTTVSDIFIKIFKCISLPIIALSLIVTLSQYVADGPMRGVWQKTLFYTLSTTLLAATVACVLYLIVAPQPVTGTIPSVISSPHKADYFTYVTNIIPANIFSPFLEHQVMGVLLVSIIVGLAIRAIPEEDTRQSITHFFKGAHGIFLALTGWIVKIIPLALYGFITATILQLKSGVDIRGLGGYLGVVVLANLIQGLVILPVFLSLNGVRPFQALQGMLPALSMAFFSKSSAGTLPLTMATAEKNLGIRPSISRFVLPLCTSINMNGCAAFIFTTVMYLMENNGASISLGTMALWIIVSTIAAIGNAGVPMGCFFLSASLLTSMDIPITLLGLILPFYSMIDMVETALNVWSDSCVAKVIDTQTLKELTV